MYTKQLKIGENLRILRQNAGVTQDRLAEYLGITSQAVSRWESGICYPDIQFLPGIASFLGTTVDTLLGCDQTKKEQNDAVLAMSALVSAGKRDEAVAFAHEKMALYPGNDMLAVMLASMMMLYDKSDMQAMDRYREGEMLCRRILRDNHDCSLAGDLLRLTAKNTLSHLLERQDRREDAIQFAEELPSYTSGREFLLITLQPPEKKSTYLASILPGYISMLTRNLIDTARMPDKNVHLWEYSLADCRRTLSVWNNVYDAVEDLLGTDARYAPFLSGYLYFRMACLLSLKQDAEDDLSAALDCFCRCLETDSTDPTSHALMENLRKNDPGCKSGRNPASACTSGEKTAFFHDGYLSDMDISRTGYPSLWQKTIEKIRSIR